MGRRRSTSALQRLIVRLAVIPSPGNVNPPLDLRQQMHLSDQPAKILMQSLADHPSAQDATQKDAHHMAIPSRAVKLRPWETPFGLLHLRARGTTSREIPTMSPTSLLLLLLLLVDPTPCTQPVQSRSSLPEACTSPIPTAHTSTSQRIRECRIMRGLGRHRQGATARRSLPTSGVRFDKRASGRAHTLLHLLISPLHSNGFLRGNFVLRRSSL